MQNKCPNLFFLKQNYQFSSWKISLILLYYISKHMNARRLISKRQLSCCSAWNSIFIMWLEGLIKLINQDKWSWNASSSTRNFNSSFFSNDDMCSKTLKYSLCWYASYYMSNLQANIFLGYYTWSSSSSYLVYCAHQGSRPLNVEMKRDEVI